MTDSGAVAEVVARLQKRLDELPPGKSHMKPFLSTYMRTTEAVGESVSHGLFDDAEWVERWDVAFAELYLDAHDAYIAGETLKVPRPWRRRLLHHQSYRHCVTFC